MSLVLLKFYFEFFYYFFFIPIILFKTTDFGKNSKYSITVELLDIIFQASTF